MRVTANMSAETSLYNIQQGRARLDRLQELVSSGLNVNRPSDDPVNTRTLLEVGDRVRAIDQYSSNINKANSWLKFTSTALDGLTSVVALAKRATRDITTGSTDPSIRQSVHDQLVDLKKQLVDMANTQYGDQYVFAGANNATPPFNKTNNTYAGDGTQLSIEIVQHTSQTLNITGDRLLLGTGANPSYGSTDILAAFDAIIAAVGDSTTPSNMTAISAAEAQLQAGSRQLSVATSDVLARLTRLDNMSKLNENNRNTLLEISTRIQEADYAKLGTQLNNQKTAYEASLSATAKLSQLSLLNYL